MYGQANMAQTNAELFAIQPSPCAESKCYLFSVPHMIGRVCGGRRGGRKKEEESNPRRHPREHNEEQSLTGA